MNDEAFLALRAAFFKAADAAREAEDCMYDTGRDWRACCEAVDTTRIAWRVAKTRLETYLEKETQA